VGDPMGRTVERPGGVRGVVWWLLLVLATAAIVVDLIAIFRAMRAVLDIGGSCADGGPYVSTVSCPEGSGAALALGIPGLFLFGGLMILACNKLRLPQFVALAWPALFLALGWNFLEYSLKGPGGPEVGLLICGVLFVLMAVGPLFLGLIARRKKSPSARMVALLRDRNRGALADLVEQAGPDGRQGIRYQGDYPGAGDGNPVGHPGSGYPSAAYQATGTAQPTRIVADLERLSRLRAGGALTEAEFEAAKRAAFRQGG